MILIIGTIYLSSIFFIFEDIITSKNSKWTLLWTECLGDFDTAALTNQYRLLKEDIRNGNLQCPDISIPHMEKTCLIQMTHNFLLLLYLYFL